MSVPVFVVPELPTTGRYVLDGAEGRHAAAAQRLRSGERLDLVDGRGGRACCTVSIAASDALTVTVADVVREPAAVPPVTVVQALVKGERSELAVAMLTEAGADRIVPWQAERCVVRWSGDRGAKALGRWRATAREAGKQARRSWFPEVADAAGTMDVSRLVTEVVAGGGAAYVLDEGAGQPLTAARSDAPCSVLLVVGPEGGIAPGELDALVEAGGTAARLGPSVLRASTAGVASLAVVNAATGRW